MEGPKLRRKEAFHTLCALVLGTLMHDTGLISMANRMGRMVKFNDRDLYKRIPPVLVDC